MLDPSTGFEPDRGPEANWESLTEVEREFYVTALQRTLLHRNLVDAALGKRFLTMPARQARLGIFALFLGALSLGIVIGHTKWPMKILAPLHASSVSIASHYDLRREFFQLSRLKTASVVMVGDSITEGTDWPALTGCKDIANRGIGSDTSRGALARIDDVMRLNPKAVIVLIGVNDLALGIPREETLANFSAIISRNEAAAIHTYVVNILPVARHYSGPITNTRIRDLNSDIADLIHGAKNATFIRVEMSDDLFGPDGLHLFPRGYAALRNALLPYIDRHCP